MKALLVTSEVTFVPDNYNQLVVGLACNPCITGLLVLRNGSVRLLGRALGLMLMGARQIGATLLSNQMGASSRKREQAYNAVGKQVWYAKTINDASVVSLVKDNAIDLLVNARTRFMYQQTILDAPRLGCINIHHGLLPEQRGTMCDLWSISERIVTGFSVHKMNNKIDDGELIQVVPTSDGHESSYPEYLLRSSKQERDVLTGILADISERDAILGRTNEPVVKALHRMDPTWRQLHSFKKVVEI
ncbi:MAG: formyltransferase family protein [Methylococcaceae bacterium]